MNGRKLFWTDAIVLGVFVLAAAGIILALLGSFGVLDIIRENIRLKVLSRQVELAEARADLEVAVAEADVIHAAAGSVRKDSALVTWYATRRDILLIAVIVLLLAPERERLKKLLGRYWPTKIANGGEHE